MAAWVLAQAQPDRRSFGKEVYIHDDKAFDGGGLRIDTVGKLTLNGRIENNSATHGGGIKVKTTSSELHFADVLVQNNKAASTGGFGGGVFFRLRYSLQGVYRRSGPDHYEYRSLWRWDCCIYWI